MAHMVVTLVHFWMLTFCLTVFGRREHALWQLVRGICMCIFRPVFRDKPWGKRRRKTIAHIEGKAILILTYRFCTC